MLLPSRDGVPDESDCRCSSATASWAARSRCCTDWSAAWAACLRFTASLACSHANAASARRWLASIGGALREQLGRLRRARAELVRLGEPGVEPLALGQGALGAGELLLGRLDAAGRLVDLHVGPAHLARRRDALFFLGGGLLLVLVLGAAEAGAAAGRRRRCRGRRTAPRPRWLHALPGSGAASAGCCCCGPLGHPRVLPSADRWGTSRKRAGPTCSPGLRLADPSGV